MSNQVERAHHHAKRLYKRAAAFNDRAALQITTSVGSMWCAYAFMGLAILGFPGLRASPAQVVQWFSQTFLQLVLLSVIMVGQTVQEELADKRHRAQELRMERMEREHGDELHILHELVADLHSHTTCDGHTTIGSTPEGAPEGAPGRTGHARSRKSAAANDVANDV